MIIFICILLVTIFLAYANGANDNFKGVATLFGIGLVNKKANLSVTRRIVLAWVFTLPLARISHHISTATASLVASTAFMVPLRLRRIRLWRKSPQRTAESTLAGFSVALDMLCMSRVSATSYAVSLRNLVRNAG